MDVSLRVDNMKVFAVDLTWVRPGIVGGTESYIRNLLDGMIKTERKDFKAILLLSRDNYESFKHYGNYYCFRIYKCKTYALVQWKRLIWQNLCLGRLLRQMQIDSCLEPTYGKPFTGVKNIRFYTVIHDLQAFHYPEYFSKCRVIWMKVSWWNAVRTSKKVIAVSDYVKQDIVKHYRFSLDKVFVVYNAVCLSKKKNAGMVLKKYGIEKGKFYYTVTSLLPHKNLRTVVLAMSRLKEKKSASFYPLVVSGVGGKRGKKELDALIKEKGMERNILFTNYIPDDERDELYRNCKAFLFPSIFEGFGMPLVEAMASGVPVITTGRASIQEVTAGLATYVSQPFNEQEWADRIEKVELLPQQIEIERLMERYEEKKIAEQYINILVNGD